MKTRNAMTVFFLSLALLIGALFLCSCQKKISQAKSKNVLRTCLNTDPITVDSRKNAEVFSSSINFLIYEGLTRILPNGEAELALAKSVDISEDGLTYIFHLREAYWTDKHPITAYDFEYSWKKVLDPQFGSPCAQIFFPIKNGEKCAKGLIAPDFVGVKAIDASTLQVQLEHPTLYFLSLITFCNFYPIAQHIEEHSPNWFQTPEKGIVSSGPFYLKKWVRNEEIVLAKNPSYWDAKNVYLEEINFSIIPNERAALQMFENGELDFISTVTTPLSSEDLGEMRAKKRLKVTPIGGLLFCTFNLKEKPYGNTNIRKALAYAIDRTAIVQNISQLSEEPATRCIPPVMAKQKKLQLFSPFDPKLAQELFKKGLLELGIDPLDSSDLSSSLVLSYPNEEPYKKIAETIQEQWKKVLGIEVRLEQKDHKSHLASIMNKDYCIALYNCIAQCTDPTNILDRFKYKDAKKNYPSFQNEEYIQLLDKASTLNDPIKRIAILEQAESLLISEMPIVPIYHFNQGILISPKFIDIQFSPLANLLFKKIKSAPTTEQLLYE